MRGLARMHEKCRRTGTGKSCGDLAADMARFSHAANNDTATTFKNRFDGMYEITIEPLGNFAQAGDFDIKSGFGKPQYSLWICK